MQIKPPKNLPRPDPFAAAEAIDARMGTTPAPFATAQPAAAHVNAPRDNAAHDAVRLPAATHGSKVRVTVYLEPEQALAIRERAATDRRSESYVVGELIGLALAGKGGA